MLSSRAILLTGATGLLGRYLLRDLLVEGRSVAVLVRDAPGQPARERIEELVALFSEVAGRSLPLPTVLAGDLGRDDLSPADRRWVGGHCQAIIHAAANLSFCPIHSGSGQGPDANSERQEEPWRTNVDGTLALLKLSQKLGLSEFHHVSTAFVCGRRRDAIREEDLCCGQEFHNDYERSKFEAERLVQGARGLRATCYRPAVIVGDSQSGYTSSYAGLYRLLELAARLARRGPEDSAVVRQPFRLRLPLGGDEACNLVPVDWVARAIVQLLALPHWHGRTFHLVAREPIPCRRIQEIAIQELGLEGVEFVGPGELVDPSRLEELFLEGVREYRPYLTGHPVFLCDNTQAALPHLPPPRLDGLLLRRLIRFAVADNWGQGRPNKRAGSSPTSQNRAKKADGPELPTPFLGPSPCVRYIEEIFPEQAARSPLAKQARLNVLVAFDIQGPGGGQWSCRWTNGELAYVRREREAGAVVTYQTDTATFLAIVQARLTTQQAFFEHALEMGGDLEMGLKLAVLFDQFIRDNPCHFALGASSDAGQKGRGGRRSTEARHAITSRA
jgi:nucleoside-diphosphate-sugar epimerase